MSKYHSLEETIYDCWKIADEHGFHDVGRSFGDAIALIHSEVSEAMEESRKPNAWQTDVAIELADVVIRVFDTAIADVGMDAEQFARIILGKMDHNRTRPRLHGKLL